MPSIEKYRKRVKCVLRVSIGIILSLLLLLVAMIFYEIRSEQELAKSFSAIQKNRALIKEFDSTRLALFQTEGELLEYFADNSTKRIENYFSLLGSTQKFLDSVYYSKDSIKSIEVEREYLLKEDLDSIAASILPKLKYVQQEKIPTHKKLSVGNLGMKVSIERTESLDTVVKKGLFKRLGNALKNEVEVQNKKVEERIIVEYFNEKTTGTLEEQFQKLLDRVNRYYIEQLNKVKNKYAKLERTKAELIEVSNTVKENSKSLLQEYEKRLVEQDSLLNKQYNIQYNKNRMLRFYVLLAVAFVLLFFTLIVVIQIRLVYKYKASLLETQTQLQHNLNIKSKMVSMISHDIRAPLKIISIYIRQLLGLEFDNKKKKIYDSIDYTTSSALLLANKILDYSKGEMHGMKLEPEKFNLYDEVEHIVESFGVLANVRDNKLINENAVPQELLVNFDRQKFQRIYFNLIDNAIKFTKSGTIKVSSRTEEIDNATLRFHLRVKDSGRGIPVENMRTICMKIRKNDDPDIKAQEVNAGLGLNLCMNVVKLFGGDLSMLSKDGEGTEVVVWFDIKK